MKYRKFGRTGLEVSEIGIGGWQLSGPLYFDGTSDGHPDLGMSHVTDLIRSMGEHGINFIDTAAQYGGGEGERRVGEALKDQRDRWVVSTKFGASVGPNGEPISDLRGEAILNSLEESLRRLKTDRIDLFLYHVNPAADQIDESAAAIQKAKDQGKIRYSGISTRNAEILPLLIEKSDVDVLQFKSSLLDTNAVMRGFVEENGLGGVVRGAFAEGRLSGKYFDKNPEFIQDDIRSVIMQDENYRRYSVLRRVVPFGMTMTQFALRYLLDIDTTHTIIIGGKNIADYEDALKTTECKMLSQDVVAETENIVSSLNSSV